MVQLENNIMRTFSLVFKSCIIALTALLAILYVSHRQNSINLNDVVRMQYSRLTASSAKPKGEVFVHASMVPMVWAKFLENKNRNVSLYSVVWEHDGTRLAYKICAHYNNTNMLSRCTHWITVSE